MKMKHYAIILFFLGLNLQIQAQDYVDVFRLSSNNGFLTNNFDSQVTGVYNQQAQLYYPIRLSESFVVLTGFTAENTNIDLRGALSRENLIMARLNLGVKLFHSDRWNGTYLILPKIASNFKQLDSRDIQIGGLALMSYKISEQLSIKFGLYVSSENHGSTITPLLGMWYRSKNRKFYINAVLPIRADINYTIVGNFSVGADLLTSVKSYDLSSGNIDMYTQEESIRIGAYLAYGFLDGAAIIRLRGGYDLSRYGLFGSSDVLGGQVLTFPLSTDNRFRLNPEFTNGPYIAGDLIYRFDLTKDKK
jgi:hypothetical protein